MIISQHELRHERMLLILFNIYCYPYLLIMNEERKGFGFEIAGVFVFHDERYVEPSVRPDDSRYGENPNRLQKHTQFQVNFGSVKFRV